MKEYICVGCGQEVLSNVEPALVYLVLRFVGEKAYAL
jgi:hypothetical protein